MGKEIERKFLVVNDSYRVHSKGSVYKQGYLSSNPEKVVRVRVVGEKAFLTVKGKADGITRLEYEYEIPSMDAEEMLEALCEKPIIEKVRYKCELGGFLWEIDEFFGENEGLTVAEIELESEEQEFVKPSWLGCEVTSDHRYYNSRLAKEPYKTWSKSTG